MSKRAAVIAMAAAGCGRFGFDSTAAAPPDPDAIAGPDAALGMFSTPTAIIELDDPTQQDDDPTLPDDMLEVFFDSSRDGGPTTGLGDIWVAKRSSVADSFGTPTLVAELASTFDDTTPDITGDGLRMYFGSDRGSPGNRDLYVTERVDRSSPWSTPVLIPELASPGSDDSGACEIDQGRGLIFGTNRGGSSDLYLATRTAIGQPWSTPVPIPGLSDPIFNENQHWCNRDGTVIYFSADLPGSDALDIWVATRAHPTDPFDPPRRVTELSTAVDDVDPWLSPDLKTMVFMSYRTGSGDIYITTR